MVNGMNKDRLIIFTLIDFLSSVKTFMFEVTEMREDFPHCFPHTIIHIVSFVCFGEALECVKAYPHYAQI
jgi:hypothetical protein